MIGIVMGSTSDWETMKAAAKVLEEFGVPYEAKAMSAHRTPHAVAEWATGAQKNGKKAIIAAWKKGIPVDGTHIERRRRVIYSLTATAIQDFKNSLLAEQ